MHHWRLQLAAYEQWQRYYEQLRADYARFQNEQGIDGSKATPLVRLFRFVSFSFLFSNIFLTMFGQPRPHAGSRPK